MFRRTKKITIEDHLKEMICYKDQITFWEKQYLNMYKELVKANKGIRRLKYKLERRNNVTNN